MAGLLKGQEDVAAHNNGDMVGDAVKIQQLGFPLEVERVFIILKNTCRTRGGRGTKRSFETEIGERVT